MQNSFGERLQIVRQKMEKTQKEFAEFLKIPQPSISSYEKNRNSPPMDVLVSISQKCNVSIDWLCGQSNDMYTLASLGDIAGFFFNLLDVNEIGMEIEVRDPETSESDNWYSRITFFGNKPEYKYNSNICKILRGIRNDYSDLESYAMSKETYDILKETAIKMLSDYPLSKKQHPVISNEERKKKHIEYIQKNQQ